MDMVLRAFGLALLAGLAACGSRTGMLSAIGGDGEAPICPGDPSCAGGTGGIGTGAGGTGGDGIGTGGTGGDGVGAGGSGAGGRGGTGGDGVGGVGGIIIVTGGTGATGGSGGTSRGGSGGSGGSGGFGPCTTDDGPCTPEQCASRCHRFRIGGYAELRSSGKRCACEPADRCADVCAKTLCVGDAPDSACERCFLPLMLNPPESCLQRACDLDGGCTPIGICGIQARDCEEFLSCLKECPPL